jgi:hypothetical protein
VCDQSGNGLLDWGCHFAEFWLFTSRCEGALGRGEVELKCGYGESEKGGVFGEPIGNHHTTTQHLAEMGLK